MKNILIFTLFLFVAFLFGIQNVDAQGGVPPYYKLGETKGSIAEVKQKIENALMVYDFQILGSYNPARDPNMLVIAFTKSELNEIALAIKDRALLASVMRVGIICTNDTCQTYLLNPDYLFYGYFRHHIEDYVLELNEISTSVKIALQQVGGTLQPVTGGSWSEDELKQFKILVNYPDFNSPVELKEFESFEEAVATISQNLTSRTGGCVKVYEQIFMEQKTAIFGVGLLDPNNGEATFLDVLGKDGKNNIAALPYEIIIEGNKATMLNGKFRFPFYWSNISTIELKAIRRVPSDIEYLLKNLTR